MKNIFSHHVSLFFPHHPRARCWLHVILLWVDHQSDRKCLHLSFLAFSACWRCFRPRSAVQHQRFIRSHTIIRAIRALQCIPEGTSARLHILTHITPAHSSLSPSPLDICFSVHLIRHLVAISRHWLYHYQGNRAGEEIWRVFCGLNDDHSTTVVVFWWRVSPVSAGVFDYILISEYLYSHKALTLQVFVDLKKSICKKNIFFFCKWMFCRSSLSKSGHV